jgi:hypothetical protein
MSEHESGQPWGEASGQQPPAYPPPQANPYGQPAPQQPPAQQPPGPAQPFGQPAYGQQPAYGAPAPAYGAPAGPPSDKRPGTVTAAAVNTIVLSAVAIVGGVLAVFGILVARDEIVAEVERQIAADPTMEQQLQGFDPSFVVTITIGVVIGFAVWALLAIVLAVLAMRRSSVGRIGLVVSSVLTALLAVLPTFTTIVPVFWLIGSIAVVVLLFTGGASQWYSRTGAPVGRGGMAPPVA